MRVKSFEDSSFSENSITKTEVLNSEFPLTKPKKLKKIVVEEKGVSDSLKEMEITMQDSSKLKVKRIARSRTKPIFKSTSD